MSGYLNGRHPKNNIKRAADNSLEGALLGCSVAGCAAGVWQVAMP